MSFSSVLKAEQKRLFIFVIALVNFDNNLIFAGDTPLTDYMLLSLSREFTNRSDLRTLAVKLGQDKSKVDTSLTNHQNDINEAAYDLLKQWRDSKYDATVAYQEICKALKDAKQTFLISKVLR